MFRKVTFLLALSSLLFSCEKSQTELADELFLSGSYSEAIEAYDIFIASHPTDEKSIYNRGRSYEELGELKNALKDFREAASIAPENIQIRQSLGLCYYKLEK